MSNEPRRYWRNIPVDFDVPAYKDPVPRTPTPVLKRLPTIEHGSNSGVRSENAVLKADVQHPVIVPDGSAEVPMKVAAPPPSLPMAALEVIDKVMAELTNATDDRVRAAKSELLVILSKDFCDVITFMGESSALYQHHMSKAAENGRVVAGHERDHLVIDQGRDILEATHDAKKRTQVALENIKAIMAESQFGAAEVRAMDNELSTDVDAVHGRMIARHTVLDAALGNIKLNDGNFYKAFARLLYDFYSDRFGQEDALEKTTIVLAARMNEEDFTRATGSEFYDLFIERRAAAARDKLHAQNTAAKDRELSHAETLVRLKTDEERAKLDRVRTLKSMVGGSDDYDPTI
jgi:hypothetical protein